VPVSGRAAIAATSQPRREHRLVAKEWPVGRLPPLRAARRRWRAQPGSSPASEADPHRLAVGWIIPGARPSVRLRVADARAPGIAAGPPRDPTRLRSPAGWRRLRS